MPRKPRFMLASIPQHVIQCGNNRKPCFLAEQDYRRYLDDLKTAADKHQCRNHAYVLMTNHVYMLVTPMKEPGIGEMMQALGRRYGITSTGPIAVPVLCGKGVIRPASLTPTPTCWPACATSN